MTRWFGIVDSYLAFSRIWFKRCVAMLYLSLLLGIIGTDAEKGWLQATFPGRSAPDSEEKDPQEAKQSTAQESESIAKLRRACRNTLQLVTVVTSGI